VLKSVFWSKSSKKGMVEKWGVDGFTEEMMAYVLVIIEEVIDTRVQYFQNEPDTSSRNIWKQDCGSIRYETVGKRYEGWLRQVQSKTAKKERWLQDLWTEVSGFAPAGVSNTSAVHQDLPMSP